MERVDYDVAILDLSDDSDEAVARRRGWIGAVLRGFRDPRPDDELVTRWVDHYRTDRVICRGAWLPEGEFGAGPMPVATYASLDKTLNAGHELLPLRMVTDVTTSATHRRRGLLTRLIEDDLADAVAAGVPVAALTASEATIYGRWGFGPATFNQTMELDASPGFALRSFTDPGRVELLEPAEAWPHVKRVFDTFHTQQRGSVEWPAPYEDIHTGAYDFNDRSPNAKIRAAVHLGGDGSVDGFVLFTPGENGSTKVAEMVALTPAAQLALWSFLADTDHVKTVTFNLAHPTTRSSGRWPTSAGSRSRASRTSCGSGSSTSSAPSPPDPGAPTTTSSWASTTRRATRPGPSRSRPRTGGPAWPAPTEPPSWCSPRRRWARSTSAGSP
ncbi:MAG: putative acetyltransferase [Nocardioides sp.]|nr:putative acetyltransferase [Nocardioides sp.]